MKKKSLLTLGTSVLALSAFLAACSEEPAATPEKPADDGQGTTEEPAAVEGGTVTFGYTQPFAGVLSYAFYEGEDDANILQFMHEGLTQLDDELVAVPNLASWEVAEDYKSVKFTLEQGVKWHDGVELTAKDMVFAWEIIGHKDYTGPRFANVSNIVGIDEYKEGTAETISGVEVHDDYSFTVNFKEPSVVLVENLWTIPEPKHHYEGVAIADLAASAQVRQTPIGVGPFKIKSITPGESVELERYEDYWQGAAKLDGVVYKIIDGALAQGLIQNGEIDIIEAPKDQWATISTLENVNPVTADAMSYSYIAFDWGKYDHDKGMVVSDNPKFQEKKLRHALAHALDRQAFIDAFANGLGKPLNAPFPSISWAAIPDSEINTYEYDVEKAKSLLDEAGYVDKDGDGFREDPKGEQFSVNFDAMSGAETSEARAQFIIQSWGEVGIKAQLNGGALKEFNLFYDTIEADDPSVETFMGAWGLAADPDPAGIWLSTDTWNMWRWYNEESDALIKKGTTLPAEGQDVIEHRTAIYHDWQKLVNEELPVIFFEQRVDPWAINKRVQGVEVTPFGVSDYHLWSVTE
ncbi:oligopeptide ABC transporter substrate-binding protein [Mangrovibacillus cuniculi]|uniref:Oligopeptide ABC transporter substrate-binding protein n=1 Tax=Mangrovibacillus cuniculi TaxID=2593652 RepID=A0A7S8C9U4_9BACI|nr:oligopeptide ABC transporter substrate-binding protein [Mangrovibacillus cuniculi]QPC46067.1 oligopeptide ABC transporter substrate-binding protein [Mangrovibacillus cuniculi]